MDYVVTITSQGQLTVPRELRDRLGIKTGTKAVITQKGNVFTVEPKKDFWSLGGAMKTKKKMTKEQLSKIRADFETKWAQND